MRKRISLFLFSAVNVRWLTIFIPIRAGYKFVLKSYSLAFRFVIDESEKKNMKMLSHKNIFLVSK